MLLANLSTPLLGLVDTAILGHLNSALYLGAVAIGAQLLTMIFWSFGFLRMGTTGASSRAIGSKNLTETKDILIKSLIFGIAISSLLLVTKGLFLEPLLKLMSDAPELYNAALSYSEIRIWAAPATLSTYVIVGWLIGIQRTRAVMAILIAMNVLNVLLDYLLIVLLDLRSDGAAIASLASEYVGFCIALVFVREALKQLGVSMRPYPKMNWPEYALLLNQSKHLFVRTLCLLFCFTFFAAQGANFGTDVLAANAILLNLLALCAYALDGFAYSVETLGGEAWGAKNATQFRITVKETWRFSILLSFAISLTLCVGKFWILPIYTDIESVLSLLDKYYFWLALLPLVAVHSYQLDGIFIGAGRTIAMQNAMLASCFLIFLPCWYLLRDFGNTGLWMSFWAFHLFRFLFLLHPFLKIYRRDFCTQQTA